MKNLKGLYTALVTPFTTDNHVDYNTLSILIEYGLSNGINGFYVCGSAGECFLLSADERKNILEFVINQTNGRATIIAHTGSIGTDLSMDLSLHAKATGADAISAVTPYYYKFSMNEIVSYYNDIASTVKSELY